MQADDQDAKEIRNLRACIGDLLGILALAAIWAGASPTRMANDLADVLIDALAADCALVRLHGHDPQKPVEIIRNSTNSSDRVSIEVLNSALAARLPSFGGGQQDVSRVQLDGEELSLIYSEIGLQNEFGVAIVGARRADFPQQTEQLLFKAAVNQALIFLQDNARLLELRRRAAELEHLVGLRTAELAASHDKLIREIAERTQIEATLAHANRLAAIGQMAAAISHELRQPIASLATSSSAAIRWLEHDPPNLSEARQSLQRIITEGLRAGSVLDRTLRLLKNQPPKREAVDLNALLAETVNIEMPRARSSRVFILCDFDDHLPRIYVDRVQIQQVVSNLLSNAMDALTSAQHRRREINLVSSYPQVGVAKITCSDTGPGIPHETIPRLFDAFFTTKTDGLGLGLAICRSIVASHGGRLWAEASPDGATFHVSLPVSKPD